MKMQINNKTKLKRVIRISLSILMILAIMIPSQISAYASPSNWITDKATGLVYDTAGVIQGYEGTASDLVIPAKLGNVTIKKIGSTAFFDNKTIVWEEEKNQEKMSHDNLKKELGL